MATSIPDRRDAPAVFNLASGRLTCQADTFPDRNATHRDMAQYGN